MKTITIDDIEYQLTPIATEAPKPVQWEPKRLDEDQNYWSISSAGKVLGRYKYHPSTNDERAAFGNYFHTEEEADEAAKQVRQLLRLRAYVREFAPDYKPDWINYSEQKWYIYFDEIDEEWAYGNNQFMHTVTTVYMSECVAEDLVCKLNSGEVVL